MEIRTGSVLFQSLRGNGPRTASQTVIFPRNVERAAVGIAGYSAGFSGDDHHFGNMQVVVDHTVNANTVDVTVTFGVRDWSGDWDDNYEGTVRFVVLADLESPNAPPRRNDMAIIDAEFSQAIQFFRSDRHLDPQTARPDNSISLLARKNTGVRLYLDCDTATATPPVTSVLGEVHIRTPSGATTTLSAIQAISPLREPQINRGSASQTLNFMIPEVWCQGLIDLEFEIFDAADPSRRSPIFERTLRFVNVAPLRVFCVGVDYTGQGLNVAAPAQPAFTSTLSWVEKVYPVGEALLTGYTTLPFSTDMRVSGDGCGDGWDGILDALRDMRGSSSDIYVGLLQGGAGIDSSIDGGSTSVVGCGGGGVAAAYAGDGVTLAQEIGHAFGRNHAPCDDPMNRCDNPSDQDDGYPNYGTYPSDSIGEFGFDPATNQVFDPASTFDFMGYSKTNWVSPYTYTGLMGSFPTSSAMMASTAIRRFDMATESKPEAIVIASRLQPPERHPGTLSFVFLRLSVTRDRKVRLEPSFHFEAEERSVPKGRPSGFVVEFQDATGMLLICRELHCTCFHCNGQHCWPKTLRSQVPFPPASRRMVVYEGDQVIFEQEIEKAPELKMRCDHKGKRHLVSWTVTGKSDGLLYLVQWKDESGIWRGVAPRTTELQLELPTALTAHRKELDLRVLACRGIATGRAEITCKLEGRPAPGTIHVHATGDLLAAKVVDASGAVDPSAELVWSDEHGAELGQGKMLDLRCLAKPLELIRVAVFNERSRVPPTLVRVGYASLVGPQVVGIFPDESRRSTHPAKHDGKPTHKH